MEVIPANHFSFEELTEIYNQTRVDYLVPMPMNVAKLREYVHVYDVDLSKSYVAYHDDLARGLGMLGVRQNRAWITRLGVLPYGRRMGTGTTLMTALLNAAARNHLDAVWLEVIKGNTPGYSMFRRFGFKETRELIIARHPPDPHTQLFPSGIKRSTFLDHEDTIILLSHRKERANWLKQTETMQNARNLSALLVELENGGCGWVSFHASLFQVTRIVVEVTAGDPAEVTATILRLLHRRYKRQDAKVENIPEDAIWQGFKRVGYFESFRRVELVRDMSTWTGSVE